MEETTPLFVVTTTVTTERVERETRADVIVVFEVLLVGDSEEAPEEAPVVGEAGPTDVDSEVWVVLEMMVVGVLFEVVVIVVAEVVVRAEVVVVVEGVVVV